MFAFQILKSFNGIFAVISLIPLEMYMCMYKISGSAKAIDLPSADGWD